MRELRLRVEEFVGEGASSPELRGFGFNNRLLVLRGAAAAAKSLQLCPTLCDP